MVQDIAVVVIGLGIVAYLVFRVLRVIRGKGPITRCGCGCGCGCGKKESSCCDEDKAHEGHPLSDGKGDEGGLKGGL